MSEQIAITPVEAVLAETQSGWHLDEMKVRFTPIAGMEGGPYITAIFRAYKDVGGVKTVIASKTEQVLRDDPSDIQRIAGLYIQKNTQLLSALTVASWIEAQSELNVPQAQIDALDGIVSETIFV